MTIKTVPEVVTLECDGKDCTLVVRNITKGMASMMQEFPEGWFVGEFANHEVKHLCRSCIGKVLVDSRYAQTEETD